MTAPKDGSRDVGHLNDIGPPPGLPSAEFCLSLRLTMEEKRAGIEKTLKSRPPGEPLRLFAFGSLMWNPEIDVDRTDPAVLKGHQRVFQTFSTRARGTPEFPGLGMCLRKIPGTSCKGILYELSEEPLAASMVALWNREQNTGIYKPSWVEAARDGAGGEETVTALTFVANEESPLFAGPKPVAEMLRIMGHAAGEYGTNRDYVFMLNKKLKELEAPDPWIISLEAELRTYLEQLDERRRAVPINRTPGG